MGDSLGGTRRLIGRLWGEAKTSLYRNAIYLMLTSVAGQGLGFLFYIFVTNLYSSSDVGFAVTLFSTISFVATLAFLGLNISLIRYLPDAQDQSDLLNTSLTLVGIACLLLGVGFLLVIAVAGLKLSFVLDSPWYPLTILVGILACGLGPVLDSAAIGLRRSDIQTGRTVAMGIIKIPVAVLLAVTAGEALGIHRFGVFVAFVVAMGSSVVIEGLWLLPRILPGYRPAIRTHFSRLRPMMRFSQGNYVAGVVSAAGVALLPLLVLETMGSDSSTQVTYFYVASAVASLLSVISGSTFTSFFAEASYKNANRHRDERRALLLTLALLAPAIIVFWIFAYYVLLIFGFGFGSGSSKYAEAGTMPLRIMTLAALPAVANNLLMTRVRVRRRTLPLIVGASISTAVVFVVGYALLQSYGITGLSIAVVLAAVAPTPYYWAVARKSFEVEPLEPLEPVVLQP